MRSSVPLKTPPSEVAHLATPGCSVLALGSPFTPAPATFRRSFVTLPLPQPTAEFALAEFELQLLPSYCRAFEESIASGSVYRDTLSIPHLQY